MQYFELDKNEQNLLRDFEKGKFKSVANTKKEIARFKRYVRQTLNKARNINIRISDKDLQKIKSQAIEKGIPYQTLISSLLHQYSSGRIKEKVL